MGARLADAIRLSRTARLVTEPAANELFVILPKAVEARLKAAGAAFNPWTTECLPPDARPGPDEAFIRLITSFQTRAEEIDAFAAQVAAA
jgi:threonine aldolase